MMDRSGGIPRYTAMTSNITRVKCIFMFFFKVPYIYYVYCKSIQSSFMKQLKGWFLLFIRKCGAVHKEKVLNLH